MYSAQRPKTYSQRKIPNPAAKVATAADLKIQSQRSQCNKHLDFLIIIFTIFPHYHTSKSDLGVCRDQVKDRPSLMTHGSLLVLHYLPFLRDRVYKKYMVSTVKLQNSTKKKSLHIISETCFLQPLANGPCAAQSCPAQAGSYFHIFCSQLAALYTFITSGSSV